MAERRAVLRAASMVGMMDGQTVVTTVVSTEDWLVDAKVDSTDGMWAELMGI